MPHPTIRNVGPLKAVVTGEGEAVRRWLEGREGVGEIRAAQMARGIIVLAIYGDGLYSHLMGGAGYANGDFATVGDQQSADGRGGKICR